MTIKYYDFGSEVIHTSERERFAAPGIVECENGKYVRREDYDRAYSQGYEAGRKQEQAVNRVRSKK